MPGRRPHPNNRHRVGTARISAIRECERINPPICHLCGLEINLTLDRKRHRLAFTVDELVPINFGGSATHQANLAPAHRVCNSLRQDRPITPDLRAACRDAVLNGSARSRRTSRRPAILTRTL